MWFGLISHILGFKLYLSYLLYCGVGCGLWTGISYLEYLGDRTGFLSTESWSCFRLYCHDLYRANPIAPIVWIYFELFRSGDRFSNCCNIDFAAHNLHIDYSVYIQKNLIPGDFQLFFSYL